MEGGDSNEDQAFAENILWGFLGMALGSLCVQIFRSFECFGEVASCAEYPLMVQMQTLLLSETKLSKKRYDIPISVINKLQI